MILKYGNFSFEDGECLISAFVERRRYNTRGRAQTKVVAMVAQGEIVADGQDDINDRMAEIQDALALEGGTAVFLKDGGGETRYKIDGASARSVRITNLSFQQQDGKAHFATGLPFSITFEGEFTISDGDTLVEYTETIGLIGTGGPRRVVVELDDFAPVEQIVSSQTATTVIQQGSAIGSSAYPAFNDPIFPTQIENPDGFQQFRRAPRWDGLALVDYPISWNYRMTFPGLPSVPPPTIR